MFIIAAATEISEGASPERLVTALILILLAGLGGGLAAKKLHQPLILGYILVGALVGIPYKLFFDASSHVAFQATANIGVAHIEQGLLGRGQIADRILSLLFVRDEIPYRRDL